MTVYEDIKTLLMFSDDEFNINMYGSITLSNYNSYIDLVLISKMTVRTSVEGLAIVSEPELGEIKNSKELGKIIDERK